MSHRITALVLLLVGCAAAYGWQLAPAGSIALVWNMSGSLYRLFLLALIALAFRSRAVVLVVLLLSTFDLMVFGCSALYLVAPWPILPGDERCSTRFNYPLGMLGAVAALALAARIVRGKR